MSTSDIKRLLAKDSNIASYNDSVFEPATDNGVESVNDRLQPRNNFIDIHQ